MISQAELRTTLDRAMREDDLLTAVLAMARLYRWLAFHIRNSKRGIVQGDSGFPDLVLCRPPRLLLVELKTEDGRLSAAQHHWLDALGEVRGVESYVWRPRQFSDGTIAVVLR